MGPCCTSSKDIDNYPSRSLRKKDKYKLKNQIQNIKVGNINLDNDSEETETK